MPPASSRLGLDIDLEDLPANPAQAADHAALVDADGLIDITAVDEGRELPPLDFDISGFDPKDSKQG